MLLNLVTQQPMKKDDSNNKVHDTNASTRNATTDDSEESVIDKLDKIQQDFKSDSNNKLSEQSDQQASPSNKTKITKKNLVRQQINPIVIVKTIKVMMVVAQH